MIEHNIIGPRRIVVTIPTIRSLCALMRIVFGVAAVAIGLERNVIDRLDVAVVAFDVQVGAIQRIISIPIMIEDTGRPFDLAVTVVAVRPEMTVVIIVFFVARYAADIQLVGERLVTVAFITSEVGMTAIACKVRIPLMVKTGVVPSGCFVAVAAVLAAEAVVIVVLFVA